MKLSELKSALDHIDQVEFVLPDGELIPSHFHVTEVGLVNKHFIDCGGTIRKEAIINFQLWSADDYDHRVSTQKLRTIIELSEKHLELDDLEIEVEYQGDTIGKFGLDFNGKSFQLTNTQTDCLAKDKCGVPEESQGRKAELSEAENSCAPGSGCC